jgi:flagellar protein FlbD
MIELHRLASTPEAFHLNPDLIVMAEGHPDVVLTLTTGTKIVVAESVEEVVDAVRTWRAAVLTEAMALH